jgi:hypothetical protein
MNKELKKLIKFITDNPECKENQKILFFWLVKKIDKYVDFDSTINKGVYMIDDVYIGRSGNIKNRITSHIMEAFEITTSKTNNTKKSEYILQVLQNRKLNVKLLSTKQEDEYKLINEYSKTKKLFNILGVSLPPDTFDSEELKKLKEENKILKASEKLLKNKNITLTDLLNIQDSNYINLKKENFQLKIQLLDFEYEKTKKEYSESIKKLQDYIPYYTI